MPEMMFDGMSPELMALLAQYGVLPPKDKWQGMPAPTGGPPPATMSEAGPYASVRPMSERAMTGLLDYGPIPAQIATSIAAQPITAGKAVGNAAADPTLANVTDAGVQTAMMAFAPLKAAKIAGLGYGIAGAKDAGLLGDAMASGDGLSDAQRAQLKELEGRISKGKWQNAAERRSVEEQARNLRTISADYAKTQNQADIARKAEEDRVAREAGARKAADDQAEYNRSVQAAERALSYEKGRANRFDDSEVGKVYNKLGIVTPALAAAGAGAITRGAASLSGHTGKAFQYGLPAAIGGVTGGITANYPLAHDAILTPAENPDRRGYEAYARELPPSHPRKQEWQDYARGLPKANETREEARRQLYDPIPLAERTGFGIAEGIASGILGGEMGKIAVKAPGIIAKGIGGLPGKFAQGAAEQSAATNVARSTAAGARADAALSQKAALEAEGRIGAQGGGLLDDVAPVAPPQVVAPRPQPQPAPVQNPQPALPAPAPQPREWAQLSPVARTVVEQHIASGAPLSSLTAERLMTAINAQIGPGMPKATLSTTRGYLANLKKDVGGTPDPKQLQSQWSANPNRFAVPIAAGAGAGLLDWGD